MFIQVEALVNPLDWQCSPGTRGRLIRSQLQVQTIRSAESTPASDCDTPSKHGENCLIHRSFVSLVIISFDIYEEPSLFADPLHHTNTCRNETTINNLINWSCSVKTKYYSPDCCRIKKSDITHATGGQENWEEVEWGTYISTHLENPQRFLDLSSDDLYIRNAAAHIVALPITVNAAWRATNTCNSWGTSASFYLHYFTAHSHHNQLKDEKEKKKLQMICTLIQLVRSL